MRPVSNLRRTADATPPSLKVLTDDTLQRLAHWLVEVSAEAANERAMAAPSNPLARTRVPEPSR
jgi:hypothetical protein